MKRKESGRLFHSLGPKEKNPQSPCFVFVRGTSRRKPLELDRKQTLGVLQETISYRYDGEFLFIVLKQKRRAL